MNKLLNFIPGRCKDVAFPERTLTKFKKEFFETVDIYNGVRERVYFSIYDCDEFRNYENASVHCLSFDLDSKNCLPNLIKMWNYCKEKNYKSLFLFSTKGFWTYIFCKNYTSLKNKKGALSYAMEHVAKEIGLTIGDPKTCDLDFHVGKDLARIARLPNGYDVRRKRYCIPITIEDMKKGYEHICEKSKKQCCDFVYYNDDYFDISKFDREPENNIEIGYLENDIKVDNNVIDKFLPCVKNCIVNTPLKGHNQYWVWTTIYMREMGLGVEAIKKLVKPYLEKHSRTDGQGNNDFEHYVVHDHLPESVFSHQYYFPNCSSLIRAKFCPGKCDKFKGDSSPLYK